MTIMSKSNVTVGEADKLTTDVEAGSSEPVCSALDRLADFVEMPRQELRIKARLMHIRRLQEVKREGFAGVMSDGRIVDRRKHPEAIPMQENSLLGIPAPRELPNNSDR